MRESQSLTQKIKSDKSDNSDMTMQMDNMDKKDNMDTTKWLSDGIRPNERRFGKVEVTMFLGRWSD